jgi:hypothetical protein
MPQTRAIRIAPALLLLGACAYAGGGSYPPSSSARAAADLPARFEPADAGARLAPADTLRGRGCLSPMLDPRDGTRLVLVRSLTSTGDYEVPGERYGVRGGELLRLECNTGQAVGIVRR